MLVVLVVVVELTGIRTVYGFADPAGEVYIGGGNQQAIVLGVDPHDALEGVFLLAPSFLIPGQIEDIVMMLGEEPPSKRHETSGIVILDSETGRARVPVRLFWRVPPLPPPGLVNGSATRADRGLTQLRLASIGVVTIFLNEAVSPDAARPPS
jgi:hypothetical protein